MEQSLLGLERGRIKGEVKDNKDYLNRIHEKSAMNLENSNKASKKKVKAISLQEREKLGEKIEKLIAESDLKVTCCSLEAWQASFAKIKAYEQAEDFSAILRLVANPIRLKILFILLDRDWACNCEFEYAFNSHQTLISHHLRNLREGGLITYKKSGQWNFYRIREEARPFLEQLRELVNLAPFEK